MRLTQELLKGRVIYCSNTGNFWRYSGVWAGGYTPAGYITVSVMGRRYRAHRLAFLYMLGRWPKGLVDHRDRDKANNRWENLRESDKSVNGQNVVSPRISNTTGFLGVLRQRKSGRFIAQIEIKSRAIYLGCYQTPEEAHLAYLFGKEMYHAS